MWLLTNQPTYDDYKRLSALFDQNKLDWIRVSAIIERINVAFGGPPAVSETDVGIMEAMIEIGADSAEIHAQFGYTLEAIDAVRMTQPSSPYRVPPT